MSEKRDNSGTLGRNERKQKDSHPDHTGQALIDGKAYWISAWVKDGQRGKFFSLSFKPKEDRRAEPSAPPSDGFDDDIPF